MSRACREHELDALLAGELSAADADRVRAHARSCATCANTRAWLQLEREWMTRRARQTPARPALSFEALEARLAAASRPATAARRAIPHRSVRQPRGLLALGTLAAVLLVMLSAVSMLQPHGTSWDPSPSSAVSVEIGPNACFEEVSQLEARFSACLVVSPIR